MEFEQERPFCTLHESVKVCATRQLLANAPRQPATEPASYLRIDYGVDCAKQLQRLQGVEHRSSLQHNRQPVTTLGRVTSKTLLFAKVFASHPPKQSTPNPSLLPLAVHVHGQDGGGKGHALDGDVGVRVEERELAGAECRLLPSPHVGQEAGAKEHLRYAAKVWRDGRCQVPMRVFQMGELAGVGSISGSVDPEA